MRLILVVLLTLWISISPLFLPVVQAASPSPAQDTQDNISNQSINTQPTVKVTEGKFRVGPTVRIRPLSNVINKSSDGLIEIYLENSDINDVPLTVEIHIAVPSGINVYGQGFGDAQAAGILYAKMAVPPGTVRTAYINIKADKIGDFYAELSGTYYPGQNKDNYQPLSFTYPFSVYEPSPDPKEPVLTNSNQIPGNEESWWKDKIVPGIIIAIIAGLIGLGYKIVEIKYQHKMEIKSRIARSKVTEKDGKITESETSESKTTDSRR